MVTTQPETPRAAPADAARRALYDRDTVQLATEALARKSGLTLE